MRKTRIFGAILLILAAAVLATGVIGSGMRVGSDELAAAQALQAAIELHQKTKDKTAPSAMKKAEAALTGAESAVKAARSAADAMMALDRKRQSGAFGDEVIDALLQAGARAVAEKKISELYEAQYAPAIKAVNDAESKLISARDGIASVYGALDVPYVLPVISKTAAADTLDAAAGNTLLAHAQELKTLAGTLQENAMDAMLKANSAVERDSMGLRDRFLLVITGSYIGVLFTGAVLLIIALVMLFAAQGFAAAWKKHPIFSTFIALLALVVVQVYALGFNFDSIGAWAGYWFSNALNVLRSNSSVGMIALGMTLVIITGGIDLAVGSTLAGVATVVMVLMDVSPNGWLTGLGVTGLPNYLIAVAAGLICGLAVGALIGLGVTKGRIPPFIITLGVMNIVRSVAQYFTKGYKVEVPREFQVLANAEIGGQMLLPILYWLLLAVIMYVISKHTAFGRHIFAVGSNERTSRLSGINVGRVKLGVYMLMGLIVAFAAVVQVARLRGVDVASAGSGYEMNAIAAVVVGGTSMAGGRGSIEGTMLGVLIIGIMNNLLVLLGIDAFLANAFTGAIIIAAVLMQRKDN